MNKKLGLILGASAALVLFAFYNTRNYCEPMYEKYPDYDRKDVRKAYNRMIAKALRGKYVDEMGTWSEEKFHKMFLLELMTLPPNK